MVKIENKIPIKIIIKERYWPRVKIKGNSYSKIKKNSNYYKKKWLIRNKLPTDVMC